LKNVNPKMDYVWHRKYNQTGSHKIISYYLG